MRVYGKATSCALRSSVTRLIIRLRASALCASMPMSQALSCRHASDKARLRSAHGRGDAAAFSTLLDGGIAISPTMPAESTPTPAHPRPSPPSSGALPHPSREPRDFSHKGVPGVRPRETRRAGPGGPGRPAASASALARSQPQPRSALAAPPGAQGAPGALAGSAPLGGGRGGGPPSPYTPLAPRALRLSPYGPPPPPGPPGPRSALPQGEGQLQLRLPPVHLGR